MLWGHRTTALDQWGAPWYNSQGTGRLRELSRTGVLQTDGANADVIRAHNEEVSATNLVPWENSVPHNDRIFRRLCVSKMSAAQLRDRFADAKSGRESAAKAEHLLIANRYYDDNPGAIYEAIVDAFAISYHQVVYLGLCDSGFVALQRELSRSSASDLQVAHVGARHSHGWRSFLLSWSVRVEFQVEAEGSPTIRSKVIHVPVLLTGKDERVAIRVLTVKNSDWMPLVGRNAVRVLGTIKQDDAADAVLAAARTLGVPIIRDFDFTTRAQEVIGGPDVDTYLASVHDPGNAGGGLATYVAYGSTGGEDDGPQRRKRQPLREDRPERLREACQTNQLFRATIKMRADLHGLGEGTSLTLQPVNGLISVGSMLKEGQFHEFIEFLMA